MDDVTDLVKWLRAQLDDDERTVPAQRNPSRAWAEVNVKRRILDLYADAVRMHGLMEETDSDSKWDWLFKSEALEGVVKLLALPYADLPGYREDWRP